MVISGDSSLFATELTAGRRSGWTLPESIERDANGLESLDAYFASDNSDSEQSYSRLDLEDPSLRKIPAIPGEPTSFTLSTPRPPAPRRTEMLPPSPVAFEPQSVSTPKRPSPLRFSVHNEAADSADDAAHAYADDADAEPEADDPYDIDDDDEGLFIDPQASSERPQLVSSPGRIPRGAPPTAAEFEQPPSSPMVPISDAIEEPSISRAPTSPALSDDSDTQRLQRVRRSYYRDPDTQQPQERYDIDVDEIGEPSYREKIVEIVQEPDVDYYSDNDSVEGMIIHDDVPEGEYHQDYRDGSDDDSGLSEADDTAPTSEIEEIEIPDHLADSPSPTGSPRRSKRNRIPTLDAWRGEYIVYDYDAVTGTRTATVAHKVAPDELPEPKSKRPRRRRAPITALDGSHPQGDVSAPLFDESIRDYKQQVLAKSLNSDEQIPFPDSPNVYISTILEGKEGLPVVIAQLTFGRGSSIPKRSSGNLYYTFIAWTGKLQFTVHTKSVVLQREGAVNIPAGNEFHIENVGLTEARVLMVQATSQERAEDFSRFETSRLSGFSDVEEGEDKHATVLGSDT